MRDTPWNIMTHLAGRLGDSGQVATEIISHLTLAQLKATAVIFEHEPPGIMIKDIADALHLTPGAVSQTVDALVRDGILERIPSPADRRAVLICPGKRGLELADARDAKISKVFDRITGDIAPAEMASFLKVLKILHANVDALAAAEPNLFA